MKTSILAMSAALALMGAAPAFAGPAPAATPASASTTASTSSNTVMHTPTTPAPTTPTLATPAGAHATAAHSTATLQPSLYSRAQTKLKADGLYNGAINGRRNEATIQAIRSFQTQHHLQVTGRLNTATTRALGV